MTCEEVLMSAMAMADGEAGAVSREKVEEHAASCPECRAAIGQMLAVSAALDGMERPPLATDLWPSIEPRLPKRSGHRALFAMAVLLAVYKIVEFAPARDFGTWVQLAPLFIAAAVFAFLKENPFQINAGLAARGEER